MHMDSLQLPPIGDKPTQFTDVLPSKFQIGDSVHVPGKITGVQFTEGKVHYLVRFDDTEDEALVDSVSLWPWPADARLPKSPPADNDHVAPGCEKFPT